MSEIAEKILKIRAYLKRQRLDGVVFSTRANWAWLTAGGEARQINASEFTPASLVVTPRSASLVGSPDVLARLLKEEPVSAFTPKPYPWQTPLPEALDKLSSGKASSWASDAPSLTGLKPLPEDFSESCRARLIEAEIRRYKALGRDCTVALETVCHALNAGDSEHQVEADLARHLLVRGIQPHQVLVSFDERVGGSTHQVPGSKHLKHHAQISISGQRHGLIASLTRTVHIGPPPRPVLERHLAATRLEVALWEATVPGVIWSDVLLAAAAQAKKDMVKDWEQPRLGGPTGYVLRDGEPYPGDRRTVQPNQAVAWHPVVGIGRSEDTILVAVGDDGVVRREVLTAASEEWPSVAIAGFPGMRRPGVLVR